MELVALVFSTTSVDFAIGSDGLTTGSLDLVLDQERTMRIVPGTPGEINCAALDEVATVRGRGRPARRRRGVVRDRAARHEPDGGAAGHRVARRRLRHADERLAAAVRAGVSNGNARATSSRSPSSARSSVRTSRRSTTSPRVRSLTSSVRSSDRQEQQRHGRERDHRPAQAGAIGEHADRQHDREAGRLEHLDDRPSSRLRDPDWPAAPSSGAPATSPSASPECTSPTGTRTQPGPTAATSITADSPNADTVSRVAIGVLAMTPARR